METGGDGMSTRKTRCLEIKPQAEQPVAVLFTPPIPWRDGFEYHQCRHCGAGNKITFCEPVSRSGV